jgi:hypothetical protein
MKIGVRPVERAFQLARSGSVQDVTEIRKVIAREGYDVRQIEGPQIVAQLKDRIWAALKARNKG